MKIFIALIPCVFFLAACGIEVQDKDKDNTESESEPVLTQPQAQVPTAFTLTKDNLEMKLQGAQPQKYDLFFKWPAVPGKIVILEGDLVWAEIPGAATKFTKTGLWHNKKYILTINHYDVLGNLLSSQQSPVTTPLDLVVGSQVLSQITVFLAHRIFLLENTVLTTGPFNVLLEAEEIHSANATIQSFPEEARATTAGSSGRSGGRIAMNVKEKAFGKIKIFLRGESGGHGLDGFFVGEKSLGCPGGPGGNGGDSSPLTTKIVDSTNFEMVYVSQPGKPGLAGRRNAAKDNTFQPPELCNPSGQNSANGAEGKVGEVSTRNTLD